MMTSLTGLMALRPLIVLKGRVSSTSLKPILFWYRASLVQCSQASAKCPFTNDASAYHALPTLLPQLWPPHALRRLSTDRRLLCTGV